MKQSKIFIYGKHALIEALQNKSSSVKKIYLAKNVDDNKLLDLIKKSKVPTVPLQTNQINSIEARGTHQGIIAQISLSELVIPFSEFIKNQNITNDTALVLLAEVQDPHNVGAVIRSSAAFGISGVLIPEHNQAPITGAVIKVSAGMAFRVPLVAIGNINQAIRNLKENDFQIYGLAGEGRTSIAHVEFDSPTVFVLGNEGEGLRQKTREYCDTLLSIPIHSRAESLNAAVSAGVALFAWSQKHPKSLKP